MNNPLWSVALGVGYTQLGARDFSRHIMMGMLEQSVPTETKYFALIAADKNRVTYSLDYLVVPLTVGFHPYKGLSLRTGVQLGYCVRNQAKGYYEVFAKAYRPESVAGNIALDQSDLQIGDIGAEVDGDLDDEVNKFDVGIPVGIGYEWKNLSVDARYVFGLTNVSKQKGEHMRNRAFMLTLGYKFKVTR
jgi:hypothetical protein